MDTISLVLTIAVLIGTAITLSAAADWLVALSCPHRWVNTALNQHHHDVWVCEECGRKTYKKPRNLP